MGNFNGITDAQMEEINDSIEAFCEKHLGFVQILKLIPDTKGGHMNNEKFNEILQCRTGKMYATLASKAKEYARGDRLHNFKKAAIRMGVSPEMALRGMMEKHAVSVDDMIVDIDAGKLPTKEYVDEKIGDLMNYLVLLEALIEDRRESFEKAELTGE